MKKIKEYAFLVVSMSSNGLSCAASYAEHNNTNQIIDKRFSTSEHKEAHAPMMPA